MPKQAKKSYSTDSFLEAFRDLGKAVLDGTKNDLVKKTGDNIASIFSPGPKPLSGSLESGQAINFSDIFSKEEELEKKYKKQVRWQTEIARRQEKVIYTGQERETKLQVQALQQEIQQLVKASAELSKEVEIASFNLPPEAGKYHINFFEKLKALIKELRSKIMESSYWLAEWNKRAQKRNFYWRQAKKQQSSFLLHHDRQVATQTG